MTISTLLADEQARKHVLDYIPMAVAVFDTDMQYLAYNTRWVEDYGLHGRELLGISHYTIFPEMPQRWRDIHQRCLQGAVEKAEFDPFPRANGDIDYSSWEIRPWYTDAEQTTIGGIIMYTNPITGNAPYKDLIQANQLFNMAVDLLGVANFEGYFVRLNNAWRDTLGYTVEEMMSQPFVSFVHPDDLEATLAEAAKANTDPIITFTNRYRAKDGSYHWLDWKSYPDTTAGLIYFVARDITAERALQIMADNQRAFLRQVLDANPSLIFVKDYDGHFVMVNQGLASVYGAASNEAMVGKRDADFNSNEEEVAQFLAVDRAVMDSNAPLTVEEQVTASDGTARWYQTIKVPFKLEERKHVVGIATDITTLKEAQLALAKNEAQYRSLVENSPDFIIVVNRQYTIDYINVVREGFDSSQVIGTSAFHFVPPESAKIMQAKIDETFAHAYPTSYEVRANNADGTTAWYSTRVLPISHEGQVNQVTLVATDITARKEIERERERLIRELEDAILFKDQFLATMSHELRTPLNAIEGYAGLILMEDETNSDIEHMATRIDNNAKRLLRLINDILDISRINANRIEIVNRPLELHKVAQGWYEDFTQLAEKKQLKFEFTLDKTLPEVIAGDEERLTQISANLLQNAFKFTENGTVKLAVQGKDADTWQIVVTDTGAGIPNTWQHLIFDEFRQVDSSSRRKYGGAGLGLSIVQKLCVLMGGNVSVESELGKGSTFTITLPLKATVPLEV